MVEKKSEQFSETRYRVTRRDGILSFRLSGISSRAPRPTVFLDRDGVLNRRISGGYVTRWADFVFLPGVVESLEKLEIARFQLVIISNQAGVAKGMLTCSDLIQITQASLKRLRQAGVVLEGAFFCLHAPSDGCPCRKPKVGLLREAARVMPIDFRRSFFVGDSPSDMQAGAGMGCATIYLGEDNNNSICADYRGLTMSDAVRWVLTRDLVLAHR
jgi:histidinol-phosphate phosphatase family protein